MAKNTLDDAIAGLKDLAKEVKRYCERLISNAKFDRTAVGTIVKVLDDHSGYVVAAFGKEYTIASNALFQMNDAVAVIAPQNDFKRLYIKPYEIDRNLLKQDKVEEDLKDYVNKVDKLQEQVDGKVEQYFYNYDPTLENWPAMSWKDDTTKKAHNGDLFYNTDSKKGWQWTYDEETKTGSWVEVTDKDTLDTLEAASKAQDTGDGKRQVFTADASKGEHPEPPYDAGDLWFNGEDILVCTVARTASDKYNASDWVKKDSYASKDDMKNYVDGVTKDMQDQIDSKAEQYFYAYDPTLDNEPAKSWTTDEEKEKHVDDLFYNTEIGKAYRFMKGDDGSYKWELVQDKDVTNALEAASKAQDTADGKRRVFTADASKDEHPDPPYDEGDLWYTGAEVLVCTTPKKVGEAYAAEDWAKKDNYTNKDEVMNEVDKTLTQEDIFNRLTDHGKSQGMFIEDGNVYFNATYIKSGEINSDLIKTGKISSKDGSVYFDLDNSEIHTTDNKFVTTLDKNSIIIKSGDNTLARLSGYDETYGTENVVQIADAMLKLDTYQYDDIEKTTTHTDTMILDGSSITFRAGEVTSSSSMSSLSKAGLSTERITFNNAIGTLTAQKESDTSGRFVIGFSTTQFRGNVQLYGNGNSMYIYDGTTNWGGQTLGWDGSKEVTTLDANTQAVPFIYGIELVKNAQGYVTDVKLKQHGLRFIGGILV
nr:MAG TPA: Putative tail protein [Caudoviricetes sp.]